MAARMLGIITTEGFTFEIWEEPNGRVHFKVDADIDAGGENGQSGG